MLSLVFHKLTYKHAKVSKIIALTLVLLSPNKLSLCHAIITGVQILTFASYVGFLIEK